MTEIEDVQAIINESGNRFHCKVLQHFREQGWYSIVSPFYTDNLTSKPREIDLVSEKEFPYGHRSFGNHGTINFKLLVECKYIPKKVVFWFDKQDMVSTLKWVERNTPLRQTSTVINDHHYIAGDNRVAKLFGSETKPNFENEVMYKALNQSLNATVYHQGLGSIIPVDSSSRRGSMRLVQYPVIVCNSFDNFWSIDMVDQHNPEKITENFKLEVNYAYLTPDGSQRSEFFIVDVVDFNLIDRYLESLGNDASSISLVLG